MSSLLVILAIVIATMMLTVLGQAIGLVQDFRVDQASQLNGNRYATFHDLTKEEAIEISKNPEFSYSGVSSNLGDVLTPTSSLSIILYEFFNHASSIYTWSEITEGQLPQTAHEIALSKEALHILKFQGDIGDSLSVPIRLGAQGNTYTATFDFVLVGVLADTYLGYISGIIPGVVGEGTTAQLLSPEFQSYSVDIRTHNTKNFQDIIDKTLHTYNKPRESVQYNEILLDTLHISYSSENLKPKTESIAFIGSAILVIALIIGASGLVIYNILKIILTKNRTYYGTLKALGAENNHIKKIVYQQIMLLLFIGIPLGICLGLFMSRYATTLVFSLLFSGTSDEVVKNSQSFEALIKNSQISVLPIIFSVFVTTLSAFLVGIPLVAYISKVSPITAIRDTNTQSFNRKSRTKTMRYFPAYYARLNLKRNRSKTYSTIGSLSLSITLLLVVVSMSHTLDTTESVAKMYLGDYAITNTSIGLDDSFAENLSNIDTLEYLYTLQFKKYKEIPFATNAPLQPNDRLQIMSLDDKRTQALLAEALTEEQQAFMQGQACIISQPSIIFENEQNPYQPLRIGDTVVIHNVFLEVVGINKEPISIENQIYGGLQIIVSSELFTSITEEENFTVLQPDFSDATDFTTVESIIDDLVSQVPETRLLPYQKTSDELSKTFQNVRVLFISFVCFIFLIGILNVINSTYTNIYTRRKEIGTCRALGMNLNKVVTCYLWESFYISVYATLLGSIFGAIGVGAFSFIAEVDMLGVTTLVASVVVIFFATFLSCVLVTYIPIQLFIKTSVVDQIRSA